MANVLDVANYFRYKSVANTEEAVTHLKLQKLVYYAQAWYAAFTNDEQLFEDRVEAWLHGPVCRSLYNEFKDFRGFEIDPLDAPPQTLSADEREHLDYIWNVYGSFSGKFLEELTHRETPWEEAWERRPREDFGNVEITVQQMGDYYRGFNN